MNCGTESNPMYPIFESSDQQHMYLYLMQRDKNWMLKQSKEYTSVNVRIRKPVGFS